MKKKNRIKSSLSFLVAAIYGVLLQWVSSELSIDIEENLAYLIITWAVLCSINIYYVEKWVDLFDNTFKNEREEEGVI